jgi:hypothetical protein
MGKGVCIESLGKVGVKPRSVKSKRNEEGDCMCLAW